MLGGGVIFWECVALEKESPSCFSSVSGPQTPPRSARRPRQPAQALSHLFAEIWHFPTAKPA